MEVLIRGLKITKVFRVLEGVHEVDKVTPTVTRPTPE